MNKTPENRPTPYAINLVIFLAGFTFLLYEVSWHRLLSLVLGTTVTASTIVLASFMAGFGMGAYFWGRTANEMSRIGRLLSVLLAGIGAVSLLNYFLFSRAVPRLYSSLAGSGIPMGVTEALVFSIVAGLLFLPAFLMGGVFPLVSKMVIGPGRSIASSLGRLYALETLGSTIGGLATGFVLLGTLGQRSTVALAVFINLSLGAWLYLTSRFSLVEQATESERPRKGAPLQTTVGKSRRSLPRDLVNLQRIALIGTFVCGLAILSLQVLWLRMFRIYLTNTSYTFALVSSLVILGLFAGSVLFKRNGHRIKDYPRSMLRIVLLLGVSTGLGLLLLVYLPHILMFPFQAMLGNPLVRTLLLPFVASMLIVFPPALFSGYAFPLACRMYTGGRENISKDVGLVLMVNTIGSFVGPIIAAFILMPLLGAAKSALLVALLSTGVALYIMQRWRFRGSSRPFGIMLYTVIAALVALLVLSPQIKILPPSFSRFDRDVLFYRESVEGTLSVGQDREMGAGTRYTYVNNSAVIGSTYDAIKVVKMVGHIPFLLGLECRDVLVIGFGIGVTTSAVAFHPEVESIECVELVEGLRDAAVYYRDLNRNVVEDPRLTLMAGDGRHYLQRTPNMYDLITCDPTHPILGSGNLYTKEYFALCKEHLKPRGMVSQYLPLHKLRPEDFLGIIGTFHSEFPNCSVWLGHQHAVLVGSLEPMRIDFNEWARHVAGIEKETYFYIDPYHLAATLILDSGTIGALAAGKRVNTDDRSYTEFFSPACLDDGNLGRNLSLLMEKRSDIGKMFQNIPDPEKMVRFVSGNRLLIESLYHRMSGDNQRSLQVLREACRVNPEDQEFPLLLKLYY